MTVKRPSRAAVGDFPRGVIQLIGRMSSLAPLAPMTFGPLDGALDDRFVAFVLVRQDAIEGVPFTPGTLAAVAFTADEIRLFQLQNAVLRLTARLAYAFSYFPVPPFVDLERADVVAAGEGEESVLAQVPMGVCHDANVMQEANRVTLTLPPAMGPDLAQILRDTGGAAALATGFTANADAYLVWRPGQQGPMAASRGQTAQRFAGAFLCFAASGDADGAMIVEDGFGLTLTQPSFELLLAALDSGGELEIPGANGLSFALRNKITQFVHPATGAVYETDGEWVEARSESGAEQTGPVRTSEVRFLTPLDQVQATIGVDPMTRLCTAIIEAVESTFGSESLPRSELMVDVALGPVDREPIVLRTKPAIEPRCMQALSERLNAVDLPASELPINFYVAFTLFDGA